MAAAEPIRPASTRSETLELPKEWLEDRLTALGPFEDRPGLAVAVSGGADSMALALLAQAWVARRQGRLLALIVDHGLRPDSAAEAATVRSRLELVGVPGLVLRWAGAKPVQGVQGAARAARYALLTAACRERGILHLLLAHHRDDQAETVALRAAAGSAADGLAGMAAVAEHRGVRLLRPCLALSHRQLAAFLAGRGLDWVEDPANRAPRFARARLRADPGFAGSRWLALSTAAGATRRLREQAVADLLARTLLPHPLGFARLHRRPLEAAEPTLRHALLRRLLTTIGGRSFAPAPAAVARLDGWDGRRRSLAGCLLERHGDHLVIVREPARISPVGEGWQGRGELTWDRRWTLAAGRPIAAVEVRPLGRMAPSSRPPHVPAVVVAGLPALWRADIPLACPPLGWTATRDLASVTARLQATIPAAPAPFMSLNVVSKADGLI